MGQKVDPRGLRLGVNKDWQSKWYDEKADYVTKLNNDLKIREYLVKELKDAAVSHIEIERKNNRNEIKIYTARPGVIIGKGGEDIEKLRAKIKKVTGEEVYVTISEVKNPNLDAQLVASNIARQIENRANFKNAQKKVIKDTMRAGAKGIKTLVAGRPGVIIGKGGEDIEKLRNKIKKVTGEEVYVTISEVKNPALDAELVAQNIAKQIENRANFKNAQKKVIKDTMRAGAKGIKTLVSGRLGGAEMARSEGYTEGTIPRQTIRADIDYATAEADTTYGKIGVKVWIYKGEILNKKEGREAIKVERKEGGKRDVNAKKN